MTQLRVSRSPYNYAGHIHFLQTIQDEGSAPGSGRTAMVALGVLRTPAQRSDGPRGEKWLWKLLRAFMLSLSQTWGPAASQVRDRPGRWAGGTPSLHHTLPAVSVTKIAPGNRLPPVLRSLHPAQGPSQRVPMRPQLFWSVGTGARVTTRENPPRSVHTAGQKKCPTGTEDVTHYKQRQHQETEGRCQTPGSGPAFPSRTRTPAAIKENHQASEHCKTHTWTKLNREMAARRKYVQHC